MWYPGTYWIQLGAKNNFDVALRDGWLSIDDKYGIHEVAPEKWSVVDLQTGISMATVHSKLAGMLFAEKQDANMEQFRATQEYKRRVNGFKKKVSEKH